MNKDNKKTEVDSTDKKLHISDVSVCLDEGQMSFIEQCKRSGMNGCSITVNNQQSWVSFTNEH